MTTQTLDESVASQIRAALGLQRMTQRALARYLDWSSAYLSRRMNGDVSFSISDLQKIATVLDITVSALTSE